MFRKDYYGAASSPIMNAKATDQLKLGWVIRTPDLLPRLAEYFYYGLLAYTMMNEAWGISIPLLGGGGMLLLAVYSAWRMKKHWAAVYGPMALLMGCAISFLIIQIAIHEQEPLGDFTRLYANWIFAVVIVQSLCLDENFLHRFALAALGISVLMLPYLTLHDAPDESGRAGLEFGLTNPNALAEWFGFLSVYLVVLAVETRRNMVRNASLIIAIACLFVMALTVSRGALAGFGLAAIVALRRILKRGFLPALIIMIVVSGVFVSGVFDESISHYAERGREETGRFAVWPLVIDRFLETPFLGVGEAKLGTYVPEAGLEISPHNGFLYFALASGIVPLLFFVGYWVKAIVRAFRATSQGLADSAFKLPLILYALIATLLSNGSYMYAWAVVVLCNATAHRTRRSRPVVLRIFEPGETVATNTRMQHRGSLAGGGRLASTPLIATRKSGRESN
jgi:O-antigen ligase